MQHWQPWRIIVLVFIIVLSIILVVVIVLVNRTLPNDVTNPTFTIPQLTPCNVDSELCTVPGTQKLDGVEQKCYRPCRLTRWSIKEGNCFEGKRITTYNCINNDTVGPQDCYLNGILYPVGTHLTFSQDCFNNVEGRWMTICPFNMPIDYTDKCPGELFTFNHHQQEKECRAINVINGKEVIDKKQANCGPDKFCFLPCFTLPSQSYLITSSDDALLTLWQTPNYNDRLGLYKEWSLLPDNKLLDTPLLFTTREKSGCSKDMINKENGVYLYFTHPLVKGSNKPTRTQIFLSFANIYHGYLIVNNKEVMWRKAINKHGDTSGITINEAPFFLVTQLNDSMLTIHDVNNEPLSIPYFNNYHQLGSISLDNVTFNQVTVETSAGCFFFQ